MPPKITECKCINRKLGRHGCPDSKALGLSAGEFNTIGAWPEEARHQMSGGRGRINPGSEFFFVARIIIPKMERKGWIKKEGCTHITITESGRELQAKIQATRHWENTQGQ